MRGISTHITEHISCSLIAMDVVGNDVEVQPETVGKVGFEEDCSISCWDCYFTTYS